MTPWQPAGAATTPAPAATAPQVPPPTTAGMVQAAGYPGAANHQGNVYPVLTPNGYVYVNVSAGGCCRNYLTRHQL